ncbi:MAG: phasin family protein [Caulobacterales bacterium]|nr:phasin family protein [Caulobacterales bacterium]
MPSANGRGAPRGDASPSVMDAWSEITKLMPATPASFSNFPNVANVFGVGSSLFSDAIAANQEFVRLAAQRVEHNLRTTAALSRCSDPGTFMTVWSDAITAATKDYTESAERIGSLWSRSLSGAADELSAPATPPKPKRAPVPAE